LFSVAGLFYDFGRVSTIVNDYDADKSDLPNMVCDKYPQTLGNALAVMDRWKDDKQVMKQATYFAELRSEAK